MEAQGRQRRIDDGEGKVGADRRYGSFLTSIRHLISRTAAGLTPPRASWRSHVRPPTSTGSAARDLETVAEGVGTDRQRAGVSRPISTVLALAGGIRDVPERAAYLRAA
jgi:hypothetical protein